MGGRKILVAETKCMGYNNLWKLVTCHNTVFIEGENGKRVMLLWILDIRVGQLQYSISCQ
jgi:hypothetical protein